jgi:hypothetical protein
MRNVAKMIRLALRKYFVLCNGDVVEYDEETEGKFYTVGVVLSHTFVTTDLETKEKDGILCVFRYKKGNLVKVWDFRNRKKIF